MIVEKTGQNNLGVGVVVPVIAPLTFQRSIDRSGLGRIVDRCLAAGASGLFVLGSAGEGVCFSRTDRETIIRTAKEHASKDAPVYAGVFDASTRRVKENIKHAEDSGADVVVFTPHYYLRSANQDEIVRHVELCSAAASVPVLVYNNPGTVHVNLSLDTVKKIMAVDRVIGLKESSQDWKHVSAELAMREGTNFKVLVGGVSLLGTALLAGADGCVLGVANYAPELIVRMYRDAKKGNVQDVLMLQQKVMRLSEATHAGDFFLAGMKYACSLMGLCEEYLCEPFKTLTKSQKEYVRYVLQQEGLLNGEG